MNLYSRRVLVTGATGGIGHAIARALAQRGARLVITGRRTDVLEPLASELGAESLAVDLSDRDAVLQLAEAAGDIDVLVANAAVPGSGPALEYSVEQIDRALDVNLRAPMILARLLGERMVARGDGHIVFVSSLAGKTVPPGSTIYSATKFGIRAFGLGLRQDLRGTGVGVSTIFPGFISGAGMLADSGVELPRGVGTKTPEDVANGVVSAIERNRGELDVAPLSVKVGAAIAGVAPGPSAAVQRRFGSHDIAERIYEGQRDKR